MATKTASIIQSGTSNYLTPAESFNVVATDLLTPGIVGSYTATSGVAPTTGSFAVNAQGSPNMTVAVSAGQAYVNATPTGGTAQNIRVSMDASENVTIAANSTGSTRYDWVYIKIDPDKLNNPATNGLDVVTLITQRSTTLATDSNGTPANALAIATVTVANGASSIANADITDRRVNIGPTALANNTILGNNLATSAIKLGYAERTSDFTTTAVSTWTDVTGLSATVTVPAGGRDIKITAFIGGLKTTAAAGTFVSMAIMEGTTVLGMGGMNEPVAAYNMPFTIVARVSAPSAGSHTYKVAVASSFAGTLTAAAGASGTASATNAYTAAFILVEAI